MSNPVYIIEVEHRPSDVQPWYAKAFRISDRSYMSGSGFFAESSAEAVTKVQAWIAAEASKMDGFTVCTDEYGEIVPRHPVRP